MDTLELSKIAGAALAALLLIFGMKTIIDSRLARAPGIAGYALPVDAAAPLAGTGEAKPAPAPVATAPTAPKTNIAAAPSPTAKPDSPKAEAPKTEGAKPATPKADAPKAEVAKPAAPAAMPAPAAPPPAAAAGGFDAKPVVAKIASASADEGKALFKKCAACHTYEKGAASKVGPNLWGVVGRPKGKVVEYAGYSEAMKAKGGEWSYESLAAFIYKPKAYVVGTKMIYNGTADPAEIANLLAYLRTLNDTPPALPN